MDSFRQSLKSISHKQIHMANSESADFMQSLIVALEQNFEHARHIEIQRQQQLYVFIILLGAVLTFIFSNTITFHLALQQFWPVFLFLAIYSFTISSSIAKWNIEFKSQLLHIQWIAEKLKLIQPISKEREAAIINSKYKEDKGALIGDSMSQGYLALALPLRKRVNLNFELIVDIILVGTTFAFVTGLLIYINSFSPFMPPLSAALPSYLLAYPIGLIFAVFFVYYNYASRKKMKKYAAKLLEARQPDGINVYYRGFRPSYDTAED